MKNTLKKPQIKFGDKEIRVTFASALQDTATSSKVNEGVKRRVITYYKLSVLKPVFFSLIIER